MEQPQKTFEEIMREEFAQQDREKKKRLNTTLLKTMCVLRFIGGAFTGLSALALLPLNDWHTIFLLLMTTGNIISLIGIWQMKKWGGYSYILLLVIQIIAIGFNRSVGMAALIGDIVCIIIVASNVDKMD